MTKRNFTMAHEIEYDDAMTTMPELIWGAGFMAPGGEGNIANVVGTDIEPQLIEQARLRVEELGIGSNCEFVTVDPGPMKFPEATSIRGTTEHESSGLKSIVEGQSPISADPYRPACLAWIPALLPIS